MDYRIDLLSNPIKISEQNWQIGITPVVSIITLTYNQENYIKDCLNGLLSQKTTFPVQILVHDDASTDCTRKIIKNFEHKYPNLIYCYLQKSNTYSSLEKQTLRAPFYNLIEGDYIAFCEGDDYWIDPLKLQKQFEFLETNPSYGLVHTNCLVSKKGKLVPIQEKERVNNGSVFLDLIAHNFFISTLTVCMRTELYKYCKRVLHTEKGMHPNWKMEDYPLWLEASLKTNIGYIPDNTAYYRILPESASHSTDKYKRYQFFESVYNIKFYYIMRELVNDNIKEKIFLDYYAGLLQYSKFCKYRAFNGLIKLISNGKGSKLTITFLKGLIL